MVEVGARLGGDLIACLAGLATGVDLPRAAGAIACGDALDLEPTLARAAAVRFLYPPFDGRLRGAGVPPHADGEDGLQLAAVTAAVGAVLQLPPRAFGARLGHVVVTGDDKEAALQRAERWAARIQVDMEPNAPRRRRPAPGQPRESSLDLVQ